MTYEEEFISNLKVLVSETAQDARRYNYTVGNTFNSRNLPVISFHTENSDIHSHQAKASQIVASLRLDTNFKELDIKEGKKIFNKVLEKPKTLLGQKVKNIILYDFIDVGEIIKDKVYRIEQRIDLLVIKY